MYYFTEPTYESLFTLLGMPVYPYALAAAIGALIFKAFRRSCTPRDSPASGQAFGKPERPVFLPQGL